MKALAGILDKLGFRDVKLRPDIGIAINYESLLLQRGDNVPVSRSRRNKLAWARATVFTLFEAARVLFDPSVADCTLAVAVKCGATNTITETPHGFGAAEIRVGP